MGYLLPISNAVSYINLTIFYYLFLFVILAIAIICIYIRFKYQFWKIQPVFHIYDLWWYLFPCGIINYQLPEKNKYTNFINIETVSFSKCSKLKITQFLNLIRLHYLQNNGNQFNPRKENVVPYFTGHNSECFFSFYYEDELITDVKTNEIFPTKKLISVTTSRPLHVTINKGKNSDAFFDAYYVDYLCVDKSRRKQNVAAQMIETLHYNCRRMNTNFQVSLFKREGEITGIVPLTIYKTIAFDMAGWSKPEDLSSYVSLVESGPSNITHLFDFFKKHNNKFDICILNETANMMELIKTRNIYVYMIIKEGVVLCVYFFRKTCVMLKKDVECLCLFASINCCKNPELFIHGYKVAIWKIYEMHTKYKCAVIEEISDNWIISDNLQKKTKPSIIITSAYFFYNFAYPTFNSKRVLIVN
jgi:hypothetical protein